jgi:hypothetical protein
MHYGPYLPAFHGGSSPQAMHYENINCIVEMISRGKGWPNSISMALYLQWLVMLSISRMWFPYATLLLEIPKVVRILVAVKAGDHLMIFEHQ